MAKRLILMAKLVGLIGLSSCGSKTSSELICPTPAISIGFATNIAPFLTSNCGCHSQTVVNRQGAPTWLNFDSYYQVLEHKTSMRQTVAAGTMPKYSTLNTNERCVFVQWIDGGYLP